MCPEVLVPVELEAETPVPCPPVSSASACHLSTEAMGPGALLVLLGATTWHGKSKTGDSALWGGCVTGKTAVQGSRKTLPVPRCLPFWTAGLRVSALERQWREKRVCVGWNQLHQGCGSVQVRGGLPRCPEQAPDAPGLQGPHLFNGRCWGPW